MSNRLWVRAALLAVLLVLIASCGSRGDKTLLQPPPLQSPPVAAPAAGSNTVVWNADHESGDFSEWYKTGPSGSGGIFNSGAADVVISQDVAHSGTHSAKATLSGDGAVRLFRWNEPRLYPELFYSVWYYFPQAYSSGGAGWNVLQWKSTNASVNDPFFVLDVGNRSGGEMYLRLYNWQTHTLYTQTQKNISTRQWVHVEAFYRCAGDGTGAIQIWQDGALLFDLHNVQTRYVDGDCQWSVDHYSSSLSPSPAVIYIDDASISLNHP